MASIAKLAIQISTDTRRMSEGLRRGQEELRGFRTSTESSAGSIMALGKGSVVAGLAFRALKIAAMEIGKGIEFAVEQATKLQDRMVAIGKLDPLKSLSGQQKRFAEQVGASVLVEQKRLTSLTFGFNKFYNTVIGRLTRQKPLSILQGLEEQEKAFKEAEEQRKREEEQLKKLQERARSLTESLRTPGEKMIDSLRELEELAKRNLISQEMLARGARKTADEFRNQIRTQIEAANKALPVAEMGSQAALSAITQARSRDTVEKEVNSRLLNEILRANMQNNAMFRQDLAKPPVKVNEGAF